MLLPGFTAYDSRNVCLPHFRSRSNVRAERKPGGIQPVFLSVRLQLLHMHMPVVVYGGRGNTSSLHVQENILPRNPKCHPLETFRYLCALSPSV